MEELRYLCIDLKSFYASVECVERGLDPMTTNLVVADPSRSDKTICLAVSPSMKALGVRNRCRVFEIPKSIEYIMAVPRMQKYIDYAAEIYGIYLRYISPDDIHVYSIDEAFLDVGPYLNTYGMTARELALELMDRIEKEVGVRATCGIGTNLYLTKIALDITAKHSPDFIGILDEERFRETLWGHRPLTDFWRIGGGTARRLADMGITTMRQIAEADEDIMFARFGVDAELMIDHAWGIEPVTIRDIKNYKPKATSLGSGQVLMRDYSFDEAKLILREMTEQLCLDLTAKGLLTSSVSFYIGYSNSIAAAPVRGTASFQVATCSGGAIVPAVLRVFEDKVDRRIPVRRVGVFAGKLTEDTGTRQLSLFDSGGMSQDASGADPERDKKVQETMLKIKDKFGKNAVFKAMDLEEAATTLERNKQIGGHKSGEE
jgi:DNA polymerase V